MKNLLYAENQIDRVSGGGFYACEVAGTSFNQNNIQLICGPKETKGHAHSCFANLVCENDNQYDVNAVRVEIADRKIGYLPKIKAIAYRKAVGSSATVVECPAIITGGWKDDISEGHFGVKLDLPYKYFNEISESCNW